MITISEQRINAAVEQVRESKVFDAHLLSHSQVEAAFKRYMEKQIQNLLDDPEYWIRDIDMHGKFGLPYAEDAAFVE